MTATLTDPLDGRPVRAVRAGTGLLPGYLAWRRLGAGHPGLPRLLADGVACDPPHPVLEWLDGPALDDALAERGPLDAREALALAAQLAASLRWLHARRLAHCDVTPANVVLRDGWPTLIDLGAVRAVGTPVDAGEVGTPGYTAPELERGEPVTPAVDVYGLGVVLRDAVGDASLAPLVATMLAPDPADRPRDADELLALLASASTTVTGPPWPRFAERCRPGCAGVHSSS